MDVMRILRSSLPSDGNDRITFLGEAVLIFKARHIASSLWTTIETALVIGRSGAQPLIATRKLYRTTKDFSIERKKQRRF